MLPNILILGGYGNFGSVENFRSELKPVALDIFSEDCSDQLKNLSPFGSFTLAGHFNKELSPLVKIIVAISDWLHPFGSLLKIFP